MISACGASPPQAPEHPAEPRGVLVRVRPGRLEHVVGAADERHQVGLELDRARSCSLSTSSLVAPTVARFS